MTHEQVVKLLEENNISEETGQGYGIKNVNHRIKLYYGGEYGLSCTSRPGRGTIVQVRLPAVKFNENLA